MILNCPSCSSRFLVDPSMIGPQGRQVRCGNCGHSWRQMPPPPPVEGQSAAEPLPRPPIRPLDEFDQARRRGSSQALAVQSEPRRSRAAVGWILLLIVVGGLAAGAWFGRAIIVAQVPEAEKLYQMAGVPVHVEPEIGEGLDFRDVTPSRRVLEGQRTLLIEGAVVNLTNEARPLPALRVILTDSRGQEVANWTHAPDLTALPPGGRARFETSMRDPPKDGEELRLSFVARE